MTKAEYYTEIRGGEKRQLVRLTFWKKYRHNHAVTVISYEDALKLLEQLKKVIRKGLHENENT